jgi:intracellular septation protein
MRYLVHTARPIFEDLISTLVFYLIFVLTGSVSLAAAVGLTIGVAQAVRHKLKQEAVPGLLVIGIALTVSLGGLSLLTHSARFLLLKPSIIYCCIGATMLPRGWVKRYVPAIALDLLPAATWDRVGWAWAWLMFGTAAVNVLLVAALPPHQAATLLLVLATGSKLALFAVQYGVLRARAEAAFRARSADPSIGEILNS